MCYHLDSSASAISVGWRIAAAAHRSRSACNCLLNQAGFSKPSPRKMAPAHHYRSGLVPNAAGPWSLSNDSASWSFDGGPRPSSPGYSHDSIFLIIASAHLATLSPQVCPRCRVRGCEPREIHLPTASRDAHGHCIFPIASFLHCFRNSKYIARRFHNGFLQVAVSKTLRRSGIERSTKYPRRIVSNTALRLAFLDPHFQPSSVTLPIG